jgi:glucose-induced degradation protein 4
MPVPLTVEVPLMQNSKQVGICKSLLYNGSKFKGYQKSKGNSYDVEVSIQVSRSSKSFMIQNPLPKKEKKLTRLQRRKKVNQ